MAEKSSYYERISLKNKTPEEAEAIKKLFNDNINMAYKVASKYYKTGYWDYEESLQIAQMGLWKACLIWDPSKYRLSTLAYNIMHRDFIDFDGQQKKQPDILFNLEDNCVTDDLTLGDVLEDEEAIVDKDLEEVESLQELNEEILVILEDISNDLHINKSVVKIIYLVFIESTKDNLMKMKDINFIPKALSKEVINELQIRLKNNL